MGILERGVELPIWLISTSILTTSDNNYLLAKRLRRG